MDLPFSPSLKNSVGMELELRLLEPNTLNIKNCSATVFKYLNSKYIPYLHKELLQSMVEVVTPVCDSIDEAVSFIEELTKHISNIGKEHNFALAALATHPTEVDSDNKIINDPRYKAFEEEFQIIIRNFLISGLHIHAGVSSEKHAINAFNATINYLALFLALSANSPFCHAEDSGLASYRTKIFTKLPRAGIPQYFESYSDYRELYSQLHSAGAIESAKDIWWDVRISPKFGTVELRVCDSFFDTDRLKFIGLLYQALVLYAKEEQPPRQYHQINMQNKWSATRYGMEGIFILHGKAVPIREKIAQLIEKFSDAGIFKELGTEEEIKFYRYIIEKPSIARILKEQYKATSSFRDAIKSEII